MVIVQWNEANELGTMRCPRQVPPTGLNIFFMHFQLSHNNSILTNYNYINHSLQASSDITSFLLQWSLTISFIHQLSTTSSYHITTKLFTTNYFQSPKSTSSTGFLHSSIQGKMPFFTRAIKGFLDPTMKISNQCQLSISQKHNVT